MQEGTFMANGKHHLYKILIIQIIALPILIVVCRLLRWEWNWVLLGEGILLGLNVGEVLKQKK